MKLESTLRTSMVAVVVAGCAMAAPSASAQTSTTTTTTTTAARKPPDSGGILSSASQKPPSTTATRDMINEAIQRSKMRSDRLRVDGKLEQFGSEDPFVFNPAQ